MDGFRTVAETIQHVLYEIFGLLLPGALFAALTTAALDRDLFWIGLETAAANPWLAAGTFYLLGYLVQGVSRPVTQTTEWLLQRPRWLLSLAGRLLPDRGAAIRADMARFEAWITGRHAHRADQPSDIDLEAEMVRVWNERLEVPTGKSVTSGQARDLSFSVLISEPNRLDRFRSAASLCRGMATSFAVALSIILTQMVRGELPVDWTSAGILALLVIGFYATIERADFYDGLWRRIIPLHFLAVVMGDEPPVHSRDATPRPVAVPVGRLGRSAAPSASPSTPDNRDGN